MAASHAVRNADEGSCAYSQSVMMPTEPRLDVVAPRAILRESSMSTTLQSVTRAASDAAATISSLAVSSASASVPAMTTKIVSAACARCGFRSCFGRISWLEHHTAIDTSSSHTDGGK